MHLRVLHRLVDTGNTVVVIEHNLDNMAETDWIVDLGPDGGDGGGGRIVAQGAPEAIVRRLNTSHTAKILGEFRTATGPAGSRSRIEIELAMLYVQQYLILLNTG